MLLSFSYICARELGIDAVDQQIHCRGIGVLGLHGSEMRLALANGAEELDGCIGARFAPLPAAGRWVPFHIQIQPSRQ